MKREIQKIARSSRLRAAAVGAMCLGAILYGGTKSGGGGDRGGAGSRRAGAETPGASKVGRDSPGPMRIVAWPDTTVTVDGFLVETGVVEVALSFDPLAVTNGVEALAKNNLDDPYWTYWRSWDILSGSTNAVLGGDIAADLGEGYLSSGFLRFLEVSDWDGDGLSWGQEAALGSNPLNPDSDGDGLTDFEEFGLGTDPTSDDTDGDGFTDYDETACMCSSPGVPWFTSAQWHEVLHASGVDLAVHDIPLPFPLTLDGQYCDRIALDVNGALHFGTAESLAAVVSANDPQDISSQSFVPPNAVVAPYWTDIYTRAGALSTIQTASITYCGQEYFVIQARELCFKVPGVGWCSYQVAIPRATPATDVFVRYGDTIDSRTDSVTSIGAVSAGGHVRLAHSFGTGHTVSNGTQIAYHFGTGGDPLLIDTDGDALDDDEEISFGANPRTPDTDGDGVPDVEEAQSYDTAAYLADTDADSLPDGWEILYGLDPLSGAGVDGPLGDPDVDGFSNLQELSFGTSPVLADTDGDGLSDPQEVPHVTVQTGFTWSQYLPGTVAPGMQSSNLDSGMWILDLPFDLRLAGHTLDRVAVDLEGVVRLGRGGSLNGVQSSASPLDFAGRAIDATNFVVGAYWSDLKSYVAKGSNIAAARMPYWGVDSYVVEYYGLGFAQGASSGNLRMRVIIPNGSPSNTVYVGYQWVSDLRGQRSVSVGAQSPDGRIRLPVSFGQDVSVSSETLLAFHFGTGGDPLRSDTDGDGLDDGAEHAIGTDPRQPDTDGDGLYDGWEAQYDLDPLTDNSTDLDEDNDADADWDGDGLTNLDECGFGTDPRGTDLDGDGTTDGYDTDGDGVPDGAEILQGSDPADATDGGAPNSRTLLGFYFGDHSGSHSEKYRLNVVPVSGHGDAPRTQFRVNACYGQCETNSVILKPGWSYSVTLEHAGTKYGEETDYDYTLTLSQPVPSNVIVDDPDGLFGVDDTSSSFAAAGKEAMLYVLGRPRLVPDYDRNGEIDEDDIADAATNRVFRFWINDDNDSGDENSSENDRPGSGPNCADSRVNGRCDLLDFTPVMIDVTCVFPAGTPDRIRERVSWKLESNVINAVWTSLHTSEAGDFHKVDCGAIFGPGLSQNAHEATIATLSGGALFPEAFAMVLNNAGGKGVVMIEGCSSGSLLKLKGYVDWAISAAVESKMDIRISPVENMYRWMNLRMVCGDTSGRESDFEEPANRPDFECDGRHFIFVHGYNVNYQSARGWSAEIFKRLWQSGSQSMFTAVDWYGNESQIWQGIPLFGGESLDYYVNVRHALDSAPNFSTAVNALPGNKVVLGHSLGNMLVSAAAKDYLLNYAKYYMLNAAVPIEAYDDTSMEQEMVEHSWTQVPNEKWASNWYLVFRDPADVRGTLKWNGRFSGIHDAVNCYSLTEEVLGNATTNGWGGVWSVQELFKGTAALHFVPGNCEGGWGYNGEYTVMGLLTDFAKTNEFSDVELVASPIFRKFDNVQLHYTNLISIAQTEINKVMGDGIPAVSFAAGANPIMNGSVAGNIELSPMDLPYWPDTRINNAVRKWCHSDICNLAFFYVNSVFRKIVLGENQ